MWMEICAEKIGCNHHFNFIMGCFFFINDDESLILF